MNILVTSEERSDLNDVYQIVNSLVKECGHTLLSWNEEVFDDKMPAQERLLEFHNRMDVLIVHLEEINIGVGIELGYALAKNKPIISIARLEDLDNLLPNLYSNYSIVYDKHRLNETLRKPLRDILVKNDLGTFLKSINENQKTTVFVSYSHADAEYLERLKIHIKPIERKGLLDFWADTKIKTGDKWKDSITAALDTAAIALLLISADFLASDFIVNNELPPLLKRAEKNGLTILPIIVKPCRFLSDENLSVFQALNPPSLPLSKMSESQREELYVKIADTIDSIIKLKTGS